MIGFLSSLSVLVTCDCTYVDHLSLLQTGIALERAAVPLVNEYRGDVDKVQRSIALPRHTHTVAAASAKQTHAVALLEVDGYMGWDIVLIVFGMLAWCSILHEVWHINNTAKVVDHDEDKPPREILWDIAKFFLMILVWCFHADMLGGEAYRGWFMPAFFFLSGLVSTPVKLDCLWIRKVTVAVLRDNVFNCILLMLLTHLIRREMGLGESWDWTATWFLHALCTCRIGIPLCFGLTRWVGEIGGSILLVAVAFILPYTLYGSLVTLERNVISPSTQVCLPIGSCVDYTGRIMSSWIPYSLGFLTDPRWFAVQIKHPAATLISAALVMLLWGLKCGSVWPSAVTVWFPTRVGSWQEYVHDTIVKQLYVVVFLACLAPVACIGRVIPQVFAKLGQRTLHAYLINVFLWSIGMKVTPTFEDPHSLRAVVISYAVLILATSAACSPLSEWCFRWVTSPQWIFDAGSKATSMLQKP